MRLYQEVEGFPTCGRSRAGPGWGPPESLILKHAAALDCAQLRRLAELVDEGAKLQSKDHYLVLCPSPVIAGLAYAWLRRSRGQNTEGLHLILSNTAKKVGGRSKLLKKIRRAAGEGQHVVVVSTFMLLGEGGTRLCLRIGLSSLESPRRFERPSKASLHGSGVDQIVALKNTA
ncbi:unnamed protein product [Clonostachys rosea f. rosea IK726]|uniref:Uncharacterized protein n=1 Tax=Clonostachys rosea f. rosea IK726 TaxID=1349383 RepID=A0ACA9UDI6_BIOOC|nr:unnamed protein product [Clonostachys rosea f. rosea IK726]